MNASPRDLLRDALTLQALFNAAEGRSAGDDAEKLMAEAIVVLSANMWHAGWGSPRELPDAALHAIGQVAAIARARDLVLAEALKEPEPDRLSFLLDQVGWLDTLTHAPLGQLVASLQAYFNIDRTVEAALSSAVSEPLEVA